MHQRVSKKTHDPTNAPLSFISVAQQPTIGLGRIVVEVSRSHKHKHTQTQTNNTR